MTTISAKVIADSMTKAGNRLTTVELRYPRFIHAELMTHRVFSRNASSTRAIPVARQIEEVKNDPAIPIYWSRNQKGMSADDENWGEPIRVAQGIYVPRDEAWNSARYDAIRWASRFSEAQYHKQLVNRLLEPFVHINVVVSSTKWNNWDRLRMHRAAEPHIRHLAREIKKARDDSTPAVLADGIWHLPYITEDDMKHPRANWMTLGMVSSMRCARVSYRGFDDRDPDFRKDLEAYQRNLVSVDPEDPPHASPCEHPAMADGDRKFPAMWGNFDGFCQFRKLAIPNEAGEAA